VTNIISLAFVNLAKPKDGAKQELLLNEPASVENVNVKPKLILNFY
jgi:hypothetical protein